MAGMPLLVLSASDVTAVFDMDTAIESQRAAFRGLGSGRAQLPARLLLGGPDDSSSFCYAARVSPDTGAVCKFGSMAPANVERGLPAIAALVTALDAETGRPVAIMDGTTVTTLRTSAASAVAAEALARPDSTALAVLGSGVQAAAHVEALSTVLPLSEVRVWSRTVENARRLVQRLQDRFPFRCSVAESADKAVAGADVVATCTSSEVPVVDVDWLAPGTTVISVGSFAAHRSEVPAELLARAAAVVVDDVETSLEHAGPVVAAVQGGVLGRDDLVPLGDVVVGTHPGRTGDDELVFFNSVGIGVQDAAAAWAVVEAARARGLGDAVNL